MKWLKLSLVLLIFLKLFYDKDIHPVLLEIHKLTLDIKLLEMVKPPVLHSDTSSNIYDLKLNSADIIDHLLQIVKKSGAVLGEIRPLKNGSELELPLTTIYLTLYGEWQDVQKLITLLINDDLVIEIKELSVLREKIKMKLNVYHASFKEKKILPHRVLDWLGYVKKNHQSTALVRLNQGEIKQVTEGFQISEPRLHIIHFDEKTMVLQLNNHPFLLNYGESLWV